MPLHTIIFGFLFAFLDLLCIDALRSGNVKIKPEDLIYTDTFRFDSITMMEIGKWV